MTLSQRLYYLTALASMAFIVAILLVTLPH